MLSQSHHLARTRRAAAARDVARPGRGCRLARTCAAAVAAAALLASACSTEEPPAPPAAEETTTTATAAPAAPAGTAAPAVTSPCNDPEAQDLGGGHYARDGRRYELTDGHCLPRFDRLDDTPDPASDSDDTDPSGSDDSDPSGSDDTDGPQQVCLEDVCGPVETDDDGAIKLPRETISHEHPSEDELVAEPGTEPQDAPSDTPDADDETATPTTLPEPETDADPETVPETDADPETEPEETTTTTAPPLPEQVGETITLVFGNDSDCWWSTGCTEPLDLRKGTVMVLAIAPDNPATVVALFPTLNDLVVVWVCIDLGELGHEMFRWAAQETPDGRLRLANVEYRRFTQLRGPCSTTAPTPPTAGPVEPTGETVRLVANTDEEFYGPAGFLTPRAHPVHLEVGTTLVFAGWEDHPKLVVELVEVSRFRLTFTEFWYWNIRVCDPIDRALTSRDAFRDDDGKFRIRLDNANALGRC